MDTHILTLTNPLFAQHLDGAASQIYSNAKLLSHVDFAVQVSIK